MAVAYHYYIDWDGDGDFSEPEEDVTAYVMPSVIQRGRSDDLGQMQAGTCELVLRNADLTGGSVPDDEGRFTPRNASSPLNTAPFSIRAGLKCQVTMVIDVTTYYLFTGYLDRPTVDHESRTVTLYFVEDMKRWGMKRIDTILLEDQRSPAILTAILTAAGYVGAGTLDAGQDVIKYCGWYQNFALDAIRELEEAEGSTLWIDGQGNIRWEDRQHRLKAPHNAPIATLSNLLESNPYELLVDNVINEAEVTATPVSVGPDAVILTLTEPFVISPGETVTQKVQYAPAKDVYIPPRIERVFDSCDDFTRWAVTAHCTLSQEIVDTKEGTGAVLVTAEDVDTIFDFHSNLAPGVDCSDFTEPSAILTFWFKSDYGSGAQYFIDFGNYYYPVTVNGIVYSLDWEFATFVITPSAGYFIFDWFRVLEGPNIRGSSILLDDIRITQAGGIVANSAPEGTGSDLAAYITVTGTPYATGASIEFTNTAAVTAYISSVTIRGKAITGDSVTRKTVDPTSQGQYGIRSYRLSSILLSNPNVAQQMADYIIATKAQPLDGLKLQFTANKTDAALLLAASLDLSDRIHVDDTPYSIDGDFFIEGIRHEIAACGLPHRVTYTISQAPAAEDLFIIGTTTFAEGHKMGY